MKPFDLQAAKAGMAPVKRTVWGNLYGNGAALWYDTEERADDSAVGDRLGGRAWPIEIEEKLLRANGYTITPPAKSLTFEGVVPITEAPPRLTRYWVVSAVDRDGVYSVPFANDEFDNYRIKRRMAYLDKEHALIAARHIFGLKGGEL